MLFHPDYRLEIIKSGGFGTSTINRVYSIDTLLRADASLPTAGDVGKMTVQLAAGGMWGGFAGTVDPQPMDGIRLWINSMYSNTLQVAWTGYIDSATPRFDTQVGPTFIIDATTPYKQFDVTSFAVSSTVNDASTLAMAYLQGIGARDLIRLAAQRVGYPGVLGALPQPAPSLQLYSGLEYSGQRSYTVPDNVFTDPELQVWASILQSVVVDTGMELWFDQFGSLHFRPLGYLTVPDTLRLLSNYEIIDLALGVSDQGVVTEVRVAPFATYDFSSYCIAYAPPALAQTIGTRIHTVQADWLQGKDAGDFLAKSLLAQYASGIARGQVTLMADPSIQPGSVIGLPPVDAGSGISLYYVTSKTYSLQWGGPWVETDTLSYGRDPRVGFPIVHAIQAPILTSTIAGGIPGGTSPFITVGGTGQLVEPFALSTIASLGPTDCTGPFPVGTILHITDTNGHELPHAVAGEYKVTATTTGNTIELQNSEGVKQGIVTVIKRGQAQDPGTTQAAPIAAPTSATPIDSTGGRSYPTPGVFAYFPVQPKTDNITQPFGPTYFTGEQIINGVHFHTGVDLGVPTGTLVVAPVAGVVVSTGWDVSGYGNKLLLQVGNLQLLFGHLSAFKVTAGAVGANQPIALTGNTGNSTGPHLHFGVQDLSKDISSPADIYGFVDPLPYIQGAQ